MFYLFRDDPLAEIDQRRTLLSSAPLATHCRPEQPESPYSWLGWPAATENPVVRRGLLKNAPIPTLS